VGRIKIASLVIAGLLVAVSTTRASADVSFDFFHSNLSSHGSWQVSTSYGNVWQPDVYSSGWHPYYDGYWDYTDVGWCWVSDYDWGAIPYHYGTWVYDDFYGWVWVPGYVWAPAWVVYRTGPDYIGWAPVLPSFSVGISVRAPVFDRRHFIFVPTRYFAGERVRRYAIPSSRANLIINNTTIVNNITIVNNVVVNRGPDTRLIERASGKRLRAVPIERVRRAMPERFSREQIRIDPRRARAGVRAAEPVKGKALPVDRGQAPGAERGRERRGRPDMMQETDRPDSEGSVERRRGPE